MRRGAELIATVDYSGRDFFTNVVVIRNKGGRFAFTEIDGDGIAVGSIAKHLLDADGDGRQEFTMKRYIDCYEGAEAAPTETLVYRWHAGKFVEASDSYAA